MDNNMEAGKYLKNALIQRGYYYCRAYDSQQCIEQLMTNVNIINRA